MMASFGNFETLGRIWGIGEIGATQNAKYENLKMSQDPPFLSTNALKFIPNKRINVNPQEPNWMNCIIKKEIRRRKRLHRKAKQSNNASHWTKFKSVKVISLIRHSKESYYEQLSMKLKSGDIFARLVENSQVHDISA